MDPMFFVGSPKVNGIVAGHSSRPTRLKVVRTAAAATTNTIRSSTTTTLSREQLNDENFFLDKSQFSA